VIPQNKKIVIDFPPGEKWAFFDFVEDSGENPVEDWLIAQTFGAKLSFQKLLKQNVRVDNHLEWGGYRHKMKGKANRRIFELEFSADKRANRVLCCFDGPKRTVLLCGCFHKDGNWTPSNAVDLAAQRLKRVENGTAKLVRRKIRYDL
jgi:phage-related protein